MRKYLALGVIAAVGGWVATKAVRGRREKAVDEGPPIESPGEIALEPETVASEESPVPEASVEVMNAEATVETAKKPRRRRARAKVRPRVVQSPVEEPHAGI